MERECILFASVCRKGYAFTTYVCEPSKLLPHFLSRFEQAGGLIVKQRVANFGLLKRDFDIVVNCSGVEAHHLVSDSSVQPKRGQVIRVLQITINSSSLLLPCFRICSRCMWDLPLNCFIPHSWSCFLYTSSYKPNVYNMSVIILLIDHFLISSFLFSVNRSDESVDNSIIK